MTNLSHSFTVDGISKTVDVDVSINVLKRREIINYGSFLEPTAVNVAYAISSTLSAFNNISISDRSTDSRFVNNSVINTDYTVTSSVDSFTINTDSFVLTDVFTDTENTIAEVPLFYKHILDTEKVPRDTDGNLDTGYVLQEVEILDQFLQVFKLEQKKIDYTAGIIYHNLLPEYNSLTDYTIYFIRYKIRTPSNTVIVYTDLLSPETTYQLADFSDLDETLSIINDGRKVYLVDETAGQFTITLPSVNVYAYQPIGTERFQILPPVAGDSDDGWFVRIFNTTNYTNIGGSLYKYSIGEFLTQSFNPYAPLKVSVRETPTILTSSLLKLNYPKVIEDDDALLFVSVHINDSNSTRYAAYTTDPSLVGTEAVNGATYTKWDRINQEGVKSIDYYTGIVEIDGLELKSTDTVEVSYYYSEENYEYSIINFNPLFNQAVLVGLTSIFIDPDSISTDKDQTLYYLHTDDSGKVIESNYTDFDNDTKLWSGKTMYYESLPSFLTSGIADVGDPNYVDPNDIDFFISKYTTIGEQSGANPYFLVLGEVTVSPNTSIEEVETLDSRRRGGGIIESEYNDALLNEPEAAWVWDEGCWDGIPYPGNASYYVEVPIDLLENAGGTFTQKEIKQIIDRHTAAGVYPIVKAYGVDISIESVVPTASGIMLEWGSDGYQI